MNMTNFLKAKGLSQKEFADRCPIPGSSLSMHLKYESNGGKGRPLGLTLCQRAIANSGGLLTLEDLRPDLSATINRIKESESATLICQADHPANPEPAPETSP
jgi:transcriptional regulator with XRE-family HTH domain